MKDVLASAVSSSSRVNITLGIAALITFGGAYLLVVGHELVHLRQFKPVLFCGRFDLASVCFSNEWGKRGVPE
jgi:hypothetical protein